MNPLVFDTFTLERLLDASPARVYETLSVPEVKARWFAGPREAWVEESRTMDFRVGGKERVAGRHQGGLTSLFDAQYLDIVPGERVVYVYDMHVNGRKISTSLATFEVLPEGAKTRLRLTEQGVYYFDPDGKATYAPDGPEVSRRRGTEGLMDQIAALFTR
ncbi:MAG: SRPBCC domain-containing protein [Polyangiaceae bacterium]